MYKCLKITFTAQLPKGYLQKTVQKSARDLAVEGVAQLLVDDFVKIIVCGPMEKVDDFLDNLYDEINSIELEELQVEPFLKDRDFRGVFRVLE
ncbi:MAG: acylphosphatase [Candidatus Dependentiae bacterium]